jgi:hypothetical protein
MSLQTILRSTSTHSLLSEMPMNIHGGGYHEDKQNHSALRVVNNMNDLGPYDILCGRCKTAFNNVGNRRYRVTVSVSLERYMYASTRKDKSIVIESVAAIVSKTGGRFFQMKRGRLVELTDKQIHEKIGHSLRDLALAATKAAASHETFGKTENALTSSLTSAPQQSTPFGLIQGTVVGEEFDEEPGSELFTSKDFFDQQVDDVDDTEPLRLDEYTQTQPSKPEHRMSVDATILSWLIGESELILSAFS